jgi:hypothetical protein
MPIDDLFVQGYIDNTSRNHERTQISINLTKHIETIIIVTEFAYNVYSINVTIILLLLLILLSLQENKHKKIIEVCYLVR